MSRLDNLLNESKVSAKHLVRNVGMSDRPSYYSGRGVTLTDLNNEKLEGIYYQIKTGYGEEAAKNFVQMVADIPVLSTTDFLLTLYRLEANNWGWDKKLLGSERGVYVDNEATAFATIMNALYKGRKVVDQTSLIRKDFLKKYKQKAETMSA